MWPFVAELRQNISLSCESACLPSAPLNGYLQNWGDFGYLERTRTLAKIGKAVCKLRHAQKMWTFTQNVTGDKTRALFSELGVARAWDLLTATPRVSCMLSWKLATLLLNTLAISPSAALK